MSYLSKSWLWIIVGIVGVSVGALVFNNPICIPIFAGLVAMFISLFFLLLPDGRVKNAITCILGVVCLFVFKDFAIMLASIYINMLGSC